MILRFSVQNFKSFKNKADLVLSPYKFRDLKENIAHKGKYKALKSIAIYGANASGKSSLVEAMFAMVYLIRQSSEFSQDREISVYEPFYFDKNTRHQPVRMAIEFVIDELTFDDQKFENTKFVYKIGYTAKEILEEELYFYPKGYKSLIFKRVKNKFDFGDYYKGERKAIINSLLPNQLFLSKSKLFNIQLLNTVNGFFEKKIIFPGLMPEMVYIINSLFKSKLFRYLAGELSNMFLPSIVIDEIDQHTLEKLSVIIKSADIGIKKLEIKSKDQKNFLEQLIGLEREALSYHTTADGRQVAFSFERESAGTQWLLALGYLLLQAVEQGAVIIIDEFEKNLHPSIVLTFLEIFNSTMANKRNAQLIFTTHNLEILEAKLLRFDQIWFTEKDELGISQLFSLKDFEGVRKENAIKDWYINGRFGAVPVIDKYSLIKVLNND